MNPSPPMAALAGKFGGFLQVDDDDEIGMTSQMSDGLNPPQMSSLEKPLKKKLRARLYKVRSI